jgi:kinetochore protein Spc24, fungi type
MAHMMDPDEDYITIAATEQQTTTTKANRKKELEEAHANLKGPFVLTYLIPFNEIHIVYFTALSRVLDAARTSSTRPQTVPTAAQHTATLNDLDATRLSLAKAINDAESSLASREAELASLKEEARVLEECDPAAEHERELNGTM